MHTFVQEIAEAKVVDRSWRMEETSPSTGHVLEAPYIDGEPDPSSDDWWSTVVRWVTRAHELPHGLRFAFPFDEHGNDALGLFASDVDGVSVARGKIVALESFEEIVLRDFWHEGYRVVEMDDFAVAGDDGIVIVACGIAPLVVAAPKRCAFGEWHAMSDERTRELAPQTLTTEMEGSTLVLAIGDVVEVRGVARPLSRTARTIDLSGWGAGYRTAPPMPDRLIGDEEGTRLILRRFG